MSASGTYAPEFGGYDSGHDDAFGSDFDPHFKVTVIHTTPEGTLSSLKTAFDLSKELGVRIGLVAMQEVPFRLPLEQPLVSTDFLRQRQSALVTQAGLDQETVTINIYLCRDQRIALSKFLKPHSLIIVGGKHRWWRPERRLEKWLSRMGHQVIFSEVDENDTFAARMSLRVMSSLLPPSS